MQFTTSEEHVRLVERAKALVARTAPGRSLGELHQQAMELLVVELEKRQFALSEPSQRPRLRPLPTTSGLTCEQHEPPASEQGEPPASEQGEPPASSDPSQPPAARELVLRSSKQTEVPFPPEQQGRVQRWRRWRGRYVPAAVKREVFVRDAGRCNYVDERGERCCETRYLELHYLQPFARGGEQVATNLELRCAAHNALAAEQDFGRALIEHKRHRQRHDSLLAHARAAIQDG